jgi:two-component system, NtrC family, nitrogen regulation sensor histidine kinase GlnL
MEKIEIDIDAGRNILSFKINGGGAEVEKKWRGQPIFHLLPDLLNHRNDLDRIMAGTGKPVSVRNFSLGCPYQIYTADLIMEPIRAGKGQEVAGARIILEIPEGCSFVKKLYISQPLIDIGKSASMLAHGVRNPLNAIKGSVAYLKGRYGKEPVLLEFADIIDQEIANLDHFITGFLSSSLDQFGKKEFDLNELLDKISAITAFQAQSSGVATEFKTEGSLPVLGNPFQLEHAILNVINNAMMALSSGGTIRVEGGIETNEAGEFAIVRIRDNGPGMPETIRRSLNGPLGEDARGKGKGFGLFLTREVVQGHGGQLKIQSSKGKGTLVTLSLPLQKQAPRNRLKMTRLKRKRG